MFIDHLPHKEPSSVGGPCLTRVSAFTRRNCGHSQEAKRSHDIVLLRRTPPAVAGGSINKCRRHRELTHPLPQVVLTRHALPVRCVIVFMKSTTE